MKALGIQTAQAVKAGMGAKRPGPWGEFLTRASREGPSLLLTASRLGWPEGKAEI